MHETATCDEAIVKALRSGIIRVDPEAGLISTRNGRLRIGRPAANTGYRQISLYQRLCLVHRIVWTAARGPAGTLVINHKNANKLDNRLVNLEAVTQSENARLYSRRDHYDYQVLDAYLATGAGADEATEVEEARAMAARGASRREIAEFIQEWRDRRDGVSPTTHPDGTLVP